MATAVLGCAAVASDERHFMMSAPRGEWTAETPTITRPDLDRDQDVTPKALRPYKVVVLDWTTVCSTSWSGHGP
jgi:hypothetical protein